MKFVTKEEFEKAIVTLKLAVKNGQVRYGHHDNQETMEGLLFSGTVKGIEGSLVDASHASFTSPFETAKNKLLGIRKELGKCQQEHVNKSKELAELEKVEKVLAALVPTLKE